MTHRLLVLITLLLAGIFPGRAICGLPARPWGNGRSAGSGQPPERARPQPNPDSLRTGRWSVSVSYGHDFVHYGEKRNDVAFWGSVHYRMAPSVKIVLETAYMKYGVDFGRVQWIMRPDLPPYYQWSSLDVVPIGLGLRYEPRLSSRNQPYLEFCPTLIHGRRTLWQTSPSKRFEYSGWTPGLGVGAGFTMPVTEVLSIDAGLRTMLTKGKHGGESYEDSGGLEGGYALDLPGFHNISGLIGLKVSPWRGQASP